MKKHIPTLLASIFCLFPVLSSAAINTKYTRSCNDIAKQSGEYPKMGEPLKSEGAVKKLTQANQFFADDQLPQAVAALKDLIANSSDESAVAQAQLLLGLVYQKQDKISQSVAEMNKALNSGVLTMQNILNVRQGLARIYMFEEKYSEAIQWMNKYFADAIKPPASQYATLSNLYYRTNKYRQAICPAILALRKGFKQKKGMYSLLFAAHYKLNDFPGAEVIARELIGLAPKEKANYSNLQVVLSKQKKQKDILALSELAYRNGVWVSETNYKQLAALYSNAKAPYLAAERFKDGLDKGIIKSEEKNWKTLARYWSNAKEYDKSIPAYQKAGQYVSHGQYDYDIATVYFEDQKFNKAIEKYNSAIKKGGLKKGYDGWARLYKGMAQYRLKQFKSAIATLNDAKKFASVKGQAAAWSNHIRNVQETLYAIK